MAGFGNLKVARYELQQFGECGLLMHNPAKLMVASGGDVTVGVKEIPAPEKEAELGAYRLPSGGLYAPTNGFYNAILSASKGMRINKKAAGPILAGGLYLQTEHTPLIDPTTGDPIKDYELDIRRVVIRGRGAVMRGRGHVRPWAATVSFTYEPAFLGEEGGVIDEMFALAGQIVGICDYRPEKKGPFGRYSVKRLPNS